jgi:hypothetical protein
MGVNVAGGWLVLFGRNSATPPRFRPGGSALHSQLAFFDKTCPAELVPVTPCVGDSEAIFADHAPVVEITSITVTQMATVTSLVARMQ